MRQIAGYGTNHGIGYTRAAQDDTSYYRTREKVSPRGFHRKQRNVSKDIDEKETNNVTARKGKKPRKRKIVE